MAACLVWSGLVAQQPSPSPTPAQPNKTQPPSTSTNELIRRARLNDRKPAPKPRSTPKPNHAHAMPFAQIAVNSGDNLQTKINSASCGDFLNLEAGATWDGTFTIAQNCSAGNPLTIRSANYASLPSGRIGSTAVTASDTCPQSANMPRIRSLAGGTYGAAFVTGANAGGIVFDGLEITDNAASSAFIAAIMDFGLTNAGAHEIIVQRCWIHQKETGTDYNRTIQRGVWFEGTDLLMKWNYIYLIGYQNPAAIGGQTFSQMDTTAMLSVTGPSTITVYDNYISVWWNGIFLGGADTAAQNTATITSGTTTSGTFSNVTGLTAGIIVLLAMEAVGTVDGTDFVCASPNFNGVHCTNFTRTSGTNFTSDDDNSNGFTGSGMNFDGSADFRAYYWKYSGANVSEIEVNSPPASGTYTATLYQTVIVTSVVGATVNYTPYGIDAITTGKVPTSAGWNVGDQGLISDVIMQRNTIVPDVAFSEDVYTHKGYTPKGLIEIKNCNRFDFNGNYVYGYPANIAFLGSNQNGQAPWIATWHVKMRNNWIEPDSYTLDGRGFLIGANTYLNTSYDPFDVEISNNLIQRVRSVGFFKGGDSWLIAHNTVINTQGTSSGYNSMTQGEVSVTGATNFVFRDNIANYVLYGAQCLTAPNTQATCWPSGTWSKNVIVDVNEQGVTTSTLGTGSALAPIPILYSQVGFTNLAGEVFSLTPSSNYYHQGTGGTDPGVDWSALLAALGTTASGTAIGGKVSISGKVTFH